MEKGRIIKIISVNRALVSVDNPGDCDYCSAKAGCNIFKKEDNTLLVKYSGKFEVDDVVNIIIKPSNRILLSSLIFFLPLLFLLIFYYLGKYFFKTDGLAALTSFTGFILSFCLILFIIKTNKNKDKLLPYIIKDTKQE